MRWQTFVLALLIFLEESKAQECRPQQFEFISALQRFNITSPNYPNPYPVGSSCRYRLIAPQDHIVVLSCRFEVFPNNCDSEVFQVSRDGDFEFRDAESFCLTQTLQRSSHFRMLAFAYRSRRPTSQFGRFACQAFVRRHSCRCGWSSNTRITNGQETQRHEFPSMVALRDITSTQRVFCGGSIITRRHILTAAHCLATQPDVNKILAYVGDHDLSTGTESAFAAQYRIRQAILHPEYIANNPNVANDIAILLTVTSFEWWSRGVGPICLPFRQAGESFAYSSVNVVGWGTLSFAGSKSNTLQKAELIVMENSVCRSRYNSSILPSQICTYDYRGRGEDSCQFDSGGPVVLRLPTGLHLIGVISYGRVCGMRYGVGVNTRITSHFNWLWTHVSQDVCVVRSELMYETEESSTEMFT